MDEKETQEKKEEPQPKEVPQETKETKEESKTPLIDDANLAAKRLEDANKELRENLAKQEELQAVAALGGQTNAGAVEPEPKKLTDIEFANTMMQRGENILDPKIE